MGAGQEGVSPEDEVVLPDGRRGVWVRSDEEATDGAGLLEPLEALLDLGRGMLCLPERYFPVKEDSLLKS